MASFVPTSPDTVEDQRLYTQARLTDVACRQMSTKLTPPDTRLAPSGSGSPRATVSSGSRKRWVGGAMLRKM